MKQITFILVFAFIAFSGCAPKNPVANEPLNCCAALKDSVEIVMNIHMKIKPEFISVYKAAFDKCQAATLKEEACLAYELYQSYKDSTEFHLFERWANKPGHLAHMETEHLKVYFQEVRGAQEPGKTKMIEVAVCPKISQK